MASSAGEKPLDETGLALANNDYTSWMIMDPNEHV
jgi:hypothetical protein